MSLWIALVICIVVFIVCAAVATLSFGDPEGRTPPATGTVIVLAGISILCAAAIVGALLHRHFA